MKTKFRLALAGTLCSISLTSIAATSVQEPKLSCSQKIHSLVPNNSNNPQKPTISELKFKLNKLSLRIDKRRDEIEALKYNQRLVSINGLKDLLLANQIKTGLNDVFGQLFARSEGLNALYIRIIKACYEHLYIRSKQKNVLVKFESRKEKNERLVQELAYLSQYGDKATIFTYEHPNRNNCLVSLRSACQAMHNLFENNPINENGVPVVLQNKDEGTMNGVINPHETLYGNNNLEQRNRTKESLQEKKCSKWDDSLRGQDKYSELNHINSKNNPNKNQKKNNHIPDDLDSIYDD